MPSQAELAAAGMSYEEANALSGEFFNQKALEELAREAAAYSSSGSRSSGGGSGYDYDYDYDYDYAPSTGSGSVASGLTAAGQNKAGAAAYVAAQKGTAGSGPVASKLNAAGQNKAGAAAYVAAQKAAASTLPAGITDYGNAISVKSLVNNLPTLLKLAKKK